MAAVDITKLFPRRFELQDETELTFYQSEIGDVGCVVWDAALVLCAYTVKCASSREADVVWDGKSVLDLGSGTGAVGLVTASLGARTVITDLPEFVPLMQHNICENKDRLKGTCTAAPLTWGHKEQMECVKGLHFPNGADYITVADCVYYEESIDDLVQTILHFSSPHTIVICSYEERDTGNKPELQKKFFKMIEEHFIVSEVPLSSQDPQYCSPDIHLMKFTLKNT